MKRAVRSCLSFTFFAAAMLTQNSPVRAQIAGTAKKQLPNVMLLVDTSGSMERMNDGSLPVCTPGTATSPNRWGSLVQAMSGTFQPYYSCARQGRSTTRFRNEFRLSPTTPIYDEDYALPYHRPLVGTTSTQMCALTHVGASLVPKYLNTATGVFGASCTFDQAEDGQLDISKDWVRFGLMTFDNEPGPTNDQTGRWSYSIGGTRQGRVANDPLGNACATVDYEVGSRSTAAPEWEGPFIPFPDQNASLADIRNQNERIQRALLALRPHGATPIDAMLEDAKNYFMTDPTGPNFVDDYAKGDCRDQYIILLTDGAPNTNLRPNCEGNGGLCPYAKATATVSSMYTAARSIPTYVIGFSVNDANGNPSAFPAPHTTCKGWYSASVGGQSGAAAAAAFAGACSAANPPRDSAAAACCSLNEIAVNGSGGPAYFAENQSDLAKAMADILARIGIGVTTRTVPTFSGVYGASSLSATFYPAFSPRAGAPWQGGVRRERFVCSGANRVEVTPSQADGDDYEFNLAEQGAASRRRVLIVNPDEIAPTTNIDARLSVRPFATGATDFASGGGTSKLTSASISSAFTSFYDARVFETLPTSCRKSVDPNPPSGPSLNIPALSALDCAKLAYGFAIAEDSSTLNFTGGYNFSRMRCPPYDLYADPNNPAPPGGCSAFGAVFHANPTYLPPPTAPLRDESYQAFALKYKDRPHTLFVATTDGLLHAFKADQVGSAHNIEMWSFIPPAVLPDLPANVPRGDQTILDGAPVVRDLVFSRSASDVGPAAITGGNAYQQWHSVLAAGFGQRRGFYALDVTNPGPGIFNAATGLGSEAWSTTNVTNRFDSGTGKVPGPQFLWQLTDFPDSANPIPGPLVRTDRAGRARYTMFGRNSAVPALTTLFFDPAAGGAGANPRELGVAILPGGMESGPHDGFCDRAVNTQTSFNRQDTAFPARNRVRKWAADCNDGVIGRSLTVVRVDTGEVIRVFGRPVDVPGVFRTSSRFTSAALDSPMIGTPVVFPIGAGAVTQKAFVGDADGTVWRFDLSSKDPALWEATMFFDTQSNNTVKASPASELDSQPILVSPVLASDTSGNVVLAVSTGEQDVLTPPVHGDNFVYSLSESFDATGKAYSKLNYFVRLENGERVTGPMTIFDSILYFATYRPPLVAAGLCSGANAFIYGMDFVQRAIAGTPGSGGIPRTFLDPVVYPTLVSPGGKIDAGTDLVPGVAIRSLAACSSVDLEQYAAGNTGSFTAGTYELILPKAKAATYAGGIRGSERQRVQLPLVRTPTRLDSWAAIVE